MNLGQDLDGTNGRTGHAGTKNSRLLNNEIVLFKFEMNTKHARFVSEQYND